MLIVCFVTVVSGNQGSCLDGRGPGGVKIVTTDPTGKTGATGCSSIPDRRAKIESDAAFQTEGLKTHAHQKKGLAAAGRRSKGHNCEKDAYEFEAAFNPQEGRKSVIRRVSGEITQLTAASGVMPVRGLRITDNYRSPSLSATARTSSAKHIARSR